MEPNYHECDCCGKFTTRLHHLWAFGIETFACDECTNYDYAAYDEPPAQWAEGPNTPKTPAG